MCESNLKWYLGPHNLSFEGHILQLYNVLSVLLFRRSCAYKTNEQKDG